MSENNSMTTGIVENEQMQTGILEELRALQKKHLFYQRVSCILILVFVVASLSVLPGIFRTLAMVQDTLETSNAAIEQAKTTLEDVSGFVTEGSDNLATAMQKIEGIDIDGLNEAISDLGAIVEPMARLFRR